MKLYLSSYRIPTPDALAELVGKSLKNLKVALIPNAKDYYSDRAWEYKVGQTETYLKSLDLDTTLVDLRKYSNPIELKEALNHFELIWVMGGNTFCLRYAMEVSGFKLIISDLLNNGVVYGGESAGAIIAGLSIKGIESADIPEFAEEIYKDGLMLIPKVVLPHVNNEVFGETVSTVRELYNDEDYLVEINDFQALIYDNGMYLISETT